MVVTEGRLEGFFGSGFRNMNAFSDNYDALPEPDDRGVVCLPEDWRDIRERRLAHFGGELGYATHLVAVALHRAGLGELAGVLNEIGGRRRQRHSTTARVVPKSQACRLLGVDKSTLAALVREGAIRTVRWRGRSNGAVSVQRERIPMSEIERLAEEGIPEPGERPPRRTHKKKAAPNVGAAILQIKL